MTGGKETHRDGIDLGLWSFGEDTPDVFMRNDERLETGPYVEDARHGGWTLSAYHDGKLKFKLEGPYVKGKKHGRWKVLAPTAYSKQLWEGSYVGGKRDGLWKYSFANRSATYYYRKGRKHGPVTYDLSYSIKYKGHERGYRGREISNHTQKLRTAYANDLLHGPYVFESNYVTRGWVDGHSRDYRNYKYRKGMYVNGERHGKWQFRFLNTKRNRNEAYYEFYENGRFIRKSSLNQAPATGETTRLKNKMKTSGPARLIERKSKRRPNKA